jgi:hypothetical protein
VTVEKLAAPKELYPLRHKIEVFIPLYDIKLYLFESAIWEPLGITGVTAASISYC